jgi:hypothetical protein
MPQPARTAASGTTEPPASILFSMSKERDDQERGDRNRERSREAHWQAAEAGAGENDAPAEAPLAPRERTDDWENEGGALDQDSAQEKGTSDTRQD